VKSREKAGKAEQSLSKPGSPFRPTTPKQVFGCLRYQGRPKTLQEMQAGIAVEARRRHARGRY
jgi:hypothetical protein